MPTDEYQIVIRADKRPAGEHERRYNSPAVDEVAVIMVGQNPTNVILLYKKGVNVYTVFHKRIDHMMPFSILSYFGRERMAITSI
jgi:hypothetical protein